LSLENVSLRNPKIVFRHENEKTVVKVEVPNGDNTMIEHPDETRIRNLLPKTPVQFGGTSTPPILKSRNEDLIRPATPSDKPGESLPIISNVYGSVPGISDKPNLVLISKKTKDLLGCEMIFQYFSRLHNHVIIEFSKCTKL
jgi:hypothetical protein